MTFMPGDVMQTFLIGIVDDAVVEDNELFAIALSSSNPNAILGPSGTVLIYDDNINDGEIRTSVTALHNFTYQFSFVLPIILHNSRH